MMRLQTTRAGAIVVGFNLSLVFLFASVFGTSAQTEDYGILTPTVAPTKTDIPTPPLLEETPDAAETPSRAPMQSFTQSDLSVMTGNVQRPNGMTWHNDRLYVSCTGDWTLYQLDSTTGQTRTYIYGVRNAHTLYAETGTNEELTLWVPDFQMNSISRVTRMGVASVASNLNGPWGISYRNENEFLVTNLLGNNVMVVNRDGTMREAVTGLASPTGITQDSAYVYIANNGSTRRAVEWYDVGQVEAGVVASSDAPQVLVSGLQNATGLTFAADGNLYIAYSLGNRGVVGRVKPDECRENGGCTPDQVEIVVLTELAAPLAGLTVSPDMRLFIHTMFSPDIYWLQLPGGEAAA